MDAQIVELINVTQSPSWLPWGVLYFFLIGLSYAGFFLSLPAFVFGRERFEGVGRLGLVVALTCGIAAPIALVADLHQPARFYHFYLHFTPGSWMSWGSFFLPAYLASLVIYAWLVYRPDLADQARSRSGVAASIFRVLGGPAAPAGVRLAGLFTAVAATLVLLYTGAEMAVVAAQPLWHGVFMPLLFVSTAVAGASGLALVLGRVFDEQATIHPALGQTLTVSAGVTLLLAMIWLAGGLLGMSVSGATALRLAMEYNPASFWLLWIILGTVLPLVLIKSRPVTAGALALFGAWIFRWSMFMDGQRIPKTGSGFFAYDIPWGSEGILSLIGTLGLWVLLLLAVTTFLPWRGSRG